MKKFKNFLYYEWKKIIAFTAVIIIILVTVKQCNDKVATDLGILYISPYNSGDLVSFREDIQNADITSDADGDNKASVKAKPVLVSNDEAINIEQQVYQQIQFEIISGENLVYLINEDILLTYAGDLCYADITDIAQKYMIPPQNCHAYDDGKIYAISLEGNAYLEGLGINTEGLFIAQRNYVNEDKDKTVNINAKKAIDYIIKQASA